jgi:hypothetical protein
MARHPPAELVTSTLGPIRSMALAAASVSSWAFLTVSNSS